MGEQENVPQTEAAVCNLLSLLPPWFSSILLVTQASPGTAGATQGRDGQEAKTIEDHVGEATTTSLYICEYWVEM